MSFGSTWSVTGVGNMYVDHYGQEKEDREFISAGKAGYKAFDNPMEIEAQTQMHEKIYGLIQNDSAFIDDMKQIQEGEYLKIIVEFKEIYSYSKYAEHDKDNKNMTTEQQMIYGEMVTGMLLKPECYIEKIDTKYEDKYGYEEVKVCFKKMIDKDKKDYDYSGMNMMKMGLKSV